MSAAVLGWVLLALLPLAASSGCNATLEFECAGAGIQCVPLEFRCDHVADCSNGRDEEGCNYLHECPLNHMICRDGECISREFKCDGTADCSDGTDERGCDALSATAASSLAPSQDAVQVRTAEDRCVAEGRFRCRHGPCVPRTALCDSALDCPEGEDEHNCGQSDDGAQCREDWIRCADKSACIPVAWLCDNREDCEDKSDEMGCSQKEKEEDLELPDMESFLTGISTTLCKAGSFRCHSGECIPQQKTCDGTADCPEGDDEGHHCEECQKLHCSHKCVESPRGARCECPEGSHLEMNGVTCSEVDKCASDGGHRCSQLCENSITEYQCRCEVGYDLLSDKHSCRLEAELASQGALFFTHKDEVRVMPLFDPEHSSTGYSIFQSVGAGGTARSLAYNRRTAHLYTAVQFADRSGKIVVAAHGKEMDFIENLQGVSHVAVDWLGNNVYFTEKHPSSHPGITVCTADGRYCRKIVHGENTTTDGSKRQIYRGFAVHPLRGLIFWIEAFDGQEHIMMARMNGEKKSTFVGDKVEYLSGLAIDHIRDDVYFSDSEKKLIERQNIDSGERHVVLSNGVHDTCELAFFNGQLFWTDLTTSSLKTSDLGGRHTPRTLHTLSSFAYGVAINHTLYQPIPEENPCDEGKKSCQYICVVVPSKKAEKKLEARCLCPDHYKIGTKGECIPIEEDKIHQKVTRLSASLMLALCEKNLACENNGRCEQHIDKDGVLRQVTCRCPAGFLGDYCEHAATPADSAMDSGSSFFVTFFLLLFLIFILLGLFYLAIQVSPSLRSSTERLVSKLPVPYRPYGFLFKSRASFEGGSPRQSSVFARDNFANPAFEQAPDHESADSVPAFDPSEKPGPSIC